MKFRKLVLFLSLSTMLAACSKDDGDDQGQKKQSEIAADELKQQTASDHTLTVTNTQGKALAKVKVLVGSALNSPFAGNFLETDSQGRVIVPADWNQALPVSFKAAGYLKSTYLAQTPQGQTYTLRAEASSTSYELSGSTTGFQVKNRDGLVDFGLIIPALSRSNLFNFQVGMILSSKNDSMSVLGQSFSIPANISVPTQKESYILPITLDKPGYRMDFPALGSQKVFTARGQFPLKKVVDALRAKKSVLDVINELQIQGGSLKEVVLKTGKNTAQLPVNELNFTQKLSFQSPLVDSDQVTLAMALSEFQGALFPTDIKRTLSNAASTMTVAAGSTPLLLAVLKNQSEFESGVGADRLSATLIPFQNKVAPQMLALLRNPQIVGKALKADVPASLPGVQIAGSFAILSKIERNGAIEKLTRLWEIYSPTWSESLDLPEWPGESAATGPKRWEISRVGSVESKKLDLGPGLFEHASHATHASVDF